MHSPAMNAPSGPLSLAVSAFHVRAWPFALLVCLALPLRADQPWREVTVPTVAGAADSFARPPMEYRAIYWAIWGGPQTKDRILANIGQVYTNGGGVFMINNARGMRPLYFTPEYFDLVKFAIEECKKRGMKVWIEGDAGYPDGFAGGMISRDYPQLGMQGIVPDLHYTLAAGQSLDIPLPVDTLGILAAPTAAPAAPETVSTNQSGTALPLPADGKFKWTAHSGGGTWEVTFQGPPPTRVTPSCPARPSRSRCRRTRAASSPIPVARRRGGGECRAGKHPPDAARGRTVQMDRARPGGLGADVHPARLSQFAHPLRQSCRQHLRQGQPLFPD